MRHEASIGLGGACCGSQGAIAGLEHLGWAKCFPHLRHSALYCPSIRCERLKRNISLLWPVALFRHSLCQVGELLSAFSALHCIVCGPFRSRPPQSSMCIPTALPCRAEVQVHMVGVVNPPARVTCIHPLGNHQTPSSAPDPFPQRMDSIV